MTPLRWLALILCAAFGVGCAPGADGRNQACANADTLLKGGYDLATASMKDAATKGTAKQLLGCFSDLVTSLDSSMQIKVTACTGTKNVAADIASAVTAGASVATAIAGWKSCSVTALAKGVM